MSVRARWDAFAEEVGELVTILLKAWQIPLFLALLVWATSSNEPTCWTTDGVWDVPCHGEGNTIYLSLEKYGDVYVEPRY